MRLIAAALLFAFVSSTDVSAQNGLIFTFSNTPGPFAVGLKVVDQYDYSRAFHQPNDELGRPYQGERARPLQTLVWYPAEPTSTKPMTVRDYTQLLSSETDFEHPHLSEHVNKSLIESMAPALDTSLRSQRDAHALVGHYPVVIYAPSFSAPSWENADLCEYIASFGYVVIASPDIGTYSRTMTQDITGLNTASRDISFLIGYAQTLHNTDMKSVAVAGFSWGGYANLFAAARDSRIDALICLDGTLRYQPQLAKEAGDIHPEQMTIPIIYFAQGESTLEDLTSIYKFRLDLPSILNEWTHGDLISVEMIGLYHNEFSAMAQRMEEPWNSIYPSFQKSDYGREDGVTGYSWIAIYTIQFLNAYLKHDSNAIRYLERSAAENGVPKHFINVKYRVAAKMPYSFEDFRYELGRKGFGNASEVYEKMQKENPELKLDETTVKTWVDALLESGDLTEAVQILEWDLKINPAFSASIYDRLGDTNDELHNKSAAIEAYQHALESHPSPFLTKLVAYKLQVLQKH